MFGGLSLSTFSIIPQSTAFGAIGDRGGIAQRRAAFKPELRRGAGPHRNKFRAVDPHVRDRVQIPKAAMIILAQVKLLLG